jgi:hypothetical protein
MLQRKVILIPVLSLLAATAAGAGEYDAKMQSFLDQSIRPWASDPIILSAVVEQNQTTGAYDQGKIDALDAEWRTEAGKTDSALINAVVTGPVADFLRTQIDAMGGQITEIIVMDSHGLNVAASATTSDYWQGDEEKYSHTYAVGPDGVHFGEIEFDDSSQTYQAQISFTLVDPATGAPVGAMTVAVDGEALL